MNLCENQNAEDIVVADQQTHVSIKPFPKASRKKNPHVIELSSPKIAPGLWATSNLVGSLHKKNLKNNKTPDNTK